MTNPSNLQSFAAAAYDRLTPIADQDEDNGFALATFLGAIGEMFQKVENYARDQEVNGETAPGWSQLLDVNRCPTEALPWLAQFVGTRINGNLPDAAQRLQISNAENWKRGSVAAMEQAALPYLTGTKTVVFSERDSGASATDAAYGLIIYTRASETTDPDAVARALFAVKPAGIVLDYKTVPGQTYEDIYVTDPTYGGVSTGFTSYQGVLLGADTLPPTPTGGQSTYGVAVYGTSTYGG